MNHASVHLIAVMPPATALAGTEGYIYDARREEEDLKAFKSVLEEGLSRLTGAGHEATGEVVTARARLAAALRALELAEREVSAAEEGLRIARLRYEAGRGIQLEILDAVAALSRARSARAEAAARTGQARADLLYATGRY